MKIDESCVRLHGNGFGLMKFIFVHFQSLFMPCAWMCASEWIEKRLRNKVVNSNFRWETVCAWVMQMQSVIALLSLAILSSFLFLFFYFAKRKFFFYFDVFVRMRTDLDECVRVTKADFKFDFVISRFVLFCAFNGTPYLPPNCWPFGVSFSLTSSSFVDSVHMFALPLPMYFFSLLFLFAFLPSIFWLEAKESKAFHTFIFSLNISFLFPLKMFIRYFFSVRFSRHMFYRIMYSFVSILK